MSKRRAPVFSIGDTEIHTWFERDRASVELREKKTGRTIAEWWDKDVGQLVEDGFLSPKNWHKSAFEYAAYLGLLVPAGRNPGRRYHFAASDRDGRAMLRARTSGDKIDAAYWRGRMVSHHLSGIDSPVGSNPGDFEVEGWFSDWRTRIGKPRSFKTMQEAKSFAKAGSRHKGIWTVSDWEARRFWYVKGREFNTPHAAQQYLYDVAKKALGRNPRSCYNPAKPDQFGPRVRFNWGFHDAAWELGRGIYRRYTDGPFLKDAPPMTYVSYKHDPAYYWGHRFGKEAVKLGTYKNNSEPAWIRFMDIYPDELKKMGVTRTGPTAYKYQELVDGKVVWRRESQPISRNASPSWHAFQAAEAESHAKMIGGSPDKPSRQYLLGVQKAHEKSIVEAKRNPAPEITTWIAPIPKAQSEGKWDWLVTVKQGNKVLREKVSGGMPVAEAYAAALRKAIQLPAAARNPVVIGAPEVQHVTVVKDSQPHKALLSSGWTLARVEGDKAIMLPPKGNPRARLNPGTDMASLMATNEFKKGVRLYEQIHGCPPKSVRRVVLPMGGKQITGRAVVVSLGKAPAESYEPRAGSRKAGRIWVHAYEAKPEKVVTADGRLIMTLPGKHAVRAGKDGEAWIHG